MTRTSWNPKSPSLIPTIVCYADILGFRSRTEHAFKSGKERKFLRKIKRSLATAYEQVRAIETSNGLEPSIFDVKFFTDNIVVAYPLFEPDSDLGEPELGTLLILFAGVQASLASDGFLLRGAIASGDHYQDNDIVYGKALLEAVDLDKSGGPPRLVIGPSVEPLVLKHLEFYDDIRRSPHYSYLLEDPRDGLLFVNYLRVAFEHFPYDRIDNQLLAAHRKEVRRGLREHKSDTSVLKKYKWLATYHDYICRTFADQFQVRGDEGVDLEKMAFSEDAQHALDYLVHPVAQPEELSPRPLDAQRLRQRLATI